GQARLGVEGVHLRRAAIHVEEEDALGLGLEVRLLGGQRVLVARRLGGRGALTEEGGQGDGAEAVGAAQEHVTAGQRGGLEAAAVHGSLRGALKASTQVRYSTGMSGMPFRRTSAVRNSPQPCSTAAARWSASRGMCA